VIQQINIGVRLREAREARGLSLHEISATTRIAVGTLEALERNEVDSLPKGIFFRSFVRSYAAEVGLDPEATLQEFLKAFPIDGLVAGGPRATDRQVEDHIFENQREIAKAWLRLTAFSLPLIGLIIYFGFVGLGSPTENEIAETPELANVVESIENALLETPLSAREGALLIDIEPQAPCWVRLTVDGEPVMSRLMQAGESLRAEANNEIVINVSDAGAFRFTLNGRAGRRLGSAREVVTVLINRDNYLDYLVS
jgi:cytoskeletal protein RodZ